MIKRLLKLLRVTGEADSLPRTPGHARMTQEDHDKLFAENVKPWRDSAERMGFDMSVFDSRIAEKKAMVDAFRAADPSRKG